MKTAFVTTLALAAALGWCAAIRARPEAAAAAAEVPARKLEAARGRYRQLCARCHDGDFSGSEWRQAGRRIPDFTSDPWHADHTDAQLVASVLEGKGTHMPAFGHALTDEQAREMVALIRKVNPARPAASKAVPSDFEIRYATLCDQLEALRKEYRELDKKPSKGEH
jgi:mono/diheme cytochrome c family protein